MTDQPSKLTKRFQHMYVTALENEGFVDHWDMPHGSRLSLLCHRGLVTLWIARRKVAESAVGLRTFRKHCGIPDDATHTPEDIQLTAVRNGETWYYVKYQWRNE